MHTPGCSRSCKWIVKTASKRSLHAPALAERQEAPPPVVPTHETPPSSETRPASKPSRREKLHIGGYYDPRDSTIIAFQKLGIDLRRSQQDMLFEAIRDFV